MLEAPSLARRGSEFLKDVSDRFAVRAGRWSRLALVAESILMFAHAIRLTLLLGATAMVPATPLVRDHVDAIELNHVYDADGRVVLRQFIFWEWRDGDGEFRVVAWRLWSEGQPLPLRDLQRGSYVLLWSDGELLRWIEADAFYETWTQFDREIEDRRWLAQDRRRGLTTDSPPSTATAPHPPRR